MDFDETKQAIIARVSLADLIGETVSLKRIHGRATGLCPFHEEKSPSFNVYDDHYYCFGCKASGDAIEYVRKRQDCGFLDALRYLGNKYQVDVSGIERKNNKTSGKRKALLQVMALAQSFFRQALTSPKGAEALAYLQKRQLDEQDINRYGLGFAPADGNVLCNYLHAKGVLVSDARSVSLLNQQQNSDFFRNRLMFPIHNIKGELLGFAGRTLINDNKLKYLNSRENSLFHKKRVLFGIVQAMQAIAETRSLLVVEGYFDWLRLHKSGIRHVVCCMGTAFSIEHLQIVKRYLDEVILLFDGDNAGIGASLHSIRLLFADPKIKFKVCRLPKDDDPDSYVLREGAESLSHYLQEKTATVEIFFIHNKFKSASLEHYPAILRNEILPLLWGIGAGVECDLLIGKVSEFSGISVQQIKRELQNKQPSARKTQTSNKIPPPVPASEKKVSPLLLEFLGHLYYAQPNKWDNTVEKYVAEEMRLSPTIMEFVGQMLANLRIGKANYQINLGADDSLPSQIKKIIKCLQQDRPAYTGVDHLQGIKKLISVHKMKKTKSNMLLLRRKLQTTSDDLDVLREISALKRLESEIYFSASAPPDNSTDV